MTVFSNNLKRFRLNKNLTQEQMAEFLGVSSQSVSRWECGTTLPDVTMLPRISEIFCVTIDDLYRENSVVYQNLAQRLLGVYEATGKPEDFLRADLGFRRLLKAGEYTDEDLRTYGILHQDMMHYCMERAEELYDRVLKKGSDGDRETYWRVKHQKSFLLHEIGRNRESIDEFLPLVSMGSGELEDWLCLIEAYTFAGDYEQAWYWAQKAEKAFPENAKFHIYLGDLCRKRKQYDDAFVHWKRALELEPQWLDAAYSMGECCEELGDYAGAYEIWCGIAENLESRGFVAEVAYPRQLANHCRAKMEQ